MVQTVAVSRFHSLGGERGRRGSSGNGQVCGGGHRVIVNSGISKRLACGAATAVGCVGESIGEGE